MNAAKNDPKDVTKDEGKDAGLDSPEVISSDSAAKQIVKDDTKDCSKINGNDIAMGKVTTRESSKLSKYLRLIIYAYLPMREIIRQISKLSKKERRNLVGSALVGQRRHAYIHLPETAMAVPQC